MKTSITQQNGELIAVLEGRLDTSVSAQTEQEGDRVFITGANADINKIFAMVGFTNLFEFR